MIEKLPKWNNYSAAATNEAVTDKTEWPLLTGKKCYVPNGLYDQSWDHVTDTYGKATLTPFYIEALTSDDQGDVQFGTYRLYSATTHQGSVYKSSQMAILCMPRRLT